MSRVGVALIVAMLSPRVAASQIPDRTYDADQQWQIISPQLGEDHHNQPSVVNGHLLLAGNARHEVWNIQNPFRPEHVTTFESPHSAGEAESHSTAFLRTADGQIWAALINGLGVDLWDLTDITAPSLLSTVELEGVNYGDNTHAVWGVFWQGDYVYAGGTDTGLHVIDARDPRAPEVVARVPTAEMGGVSAGPLFAVGNLLVVSTPKEHAGIATLDIGVPDAPAVLDFVVPERDSYIGWMFGRHVHLLSPFRTYDVTTDPRDIRLVAEAEVPRSEYMSFGDGRLFLGELRPFGGVAKIDIDDPAEPVVVGKVDGRKPDRLRAVLIDDQFSLPVGNLLIMSDDEINIGSVIAVHDAARDDRPPEVAYVNPVDGAVGQPLTSRVGVSFTDQIDLGSVDATTFVVRPVGGDALEGRYGHSQTFVNFWPAAPLEADTQYEVVLPAGGVTDLVGNALAQEVRWVFDTGADVPRLTCAIEPTLPVAVGAAVELAAGDAEDAVAFRWAFGDGATGEGQRATHAYDAPGRYRVALTVEAEGRSRTCTGTQIVHRPLPARPPASASTVAIDTERRRIWVVNQDAGTVRIVDADALEPGLEVPVGADPRTVAVGPDGRAWVAAQGDDAVVLVDADGSVERVEFRHGAAPFGVALTPDGTRAVVSLEGTGEVAVLDVEMPTAPPVLIPVESGAKLRGLSISPDGSTAWVARLISRPEGGTVYAVPLTADGEVRAHALVPWLDPDRSDGGRGVPNYLGGIALAPDGADLWVPGKKDNIARGATRDGQPLNTTNTVRTIVARVHAETGEELVGARIDLDDHNMARAVAFSPVGDLAFIASMGTNRVDVYDTYAGTLVSGFSTGLAPEGLAVSADGRLYVQATMSRSLAIYDVGALLAGRDALAEPIGEISTVETEPLGDVVLRGKQLFHNADSRQMSQDGYISCATCHLDGAEDGMIWDFTDRGEGLRNTIDLRGRAGTAHGPVHWSANFDEIHDFEHDIRGAFGGSGLMADADFAEGTRSDPLGDPKAGVSERLDALAAYVATLDTYPRSPYRAPDGSQTEAGERGADLFRALDCLDCHVGQQLTDSPDDVRHDVGTLTDASGQRLGGPLDGIDTPTLHGVWATPPYFHDGSAATLRDTIDRAGHGNAQWLDDDRKSDLVAFLSELEGEMLPLSRLPALVEPDPEPTTGVEPDAGVAPDDNGAADADGESGGGASGCAVVAERAPGTWLTWILIALGARRRWRPARRGAQR